MIRAGLIAAVLMLSAGPVLAQSANEPVMGSSVSSGDANAVADQEQIIRILTLGDAVGGGLGAGLTRMGEADGRYEVVNRYNEESGLARPEVYDWAATLPKILESNEFDAIVVLIGINDRQMIRDGNARHAFGSAEWIKAYTKQTDRVLDALKSSGARIFWVSIPPVADPEYDAALRQITGIQQERAEARGAIFVDVRPAFGTPDGGYAESGPDDTGVVRRLRGRDGVSFYKAGNNLLGKLVLDAIGTRKVPVLMSTGPAPQVRQPISQALKPARSVPVFGQTTFSGEFALLRPENVTVSTALVLSAGADGLKPSEAMEMLRGIVQPGSAAERLFTSGAAGAAPPGRADDFAAPAKPAE